MSTRTLITLSEFLELTGLAAADVVGMLGQGDLKFERGSANELLIDLTDVTPAQLASRRRVDGFASLPEDQALLLKEIVASELVNAMEHILEDAVELAVDWQLRANEAAAPTDLAKRPADD